MTFFLESKLPSLLTPEVTSIKALPSGHSEEVIRLMYIFNFAYIFAPHLQIPLSIFILRSSKDLLIPSMQKESMDPKEFFFKKQG